MEPQNKQTRKIYIIPKYFIKFSFEGQFNKNSSLLF